MLDKLRSESSSIDLSTTGDVRISDEEVIKDKINAAASLIGTERFYLEVGKTLLTRSASYGMTPDGHVVPSFETESGEKLYHRPVPDGVSLSNALGVSLAHNATIEEIATAKRSNIVVWEQDANQTLRHVESTSVSTSSSAASINVLRKDTGEYDLLEKDPSRIEAASYRSEQLEERDESSGFVINMPIGTAMALAASLNELQELTAQVHAQSLAEGKSEEESYEVAADPEVQELAKEVAEIKRQLDTELSTMSAGRGAGRKAIKGAVSEQATETATDKGKGKSKLSASSQPAPVDPNLYGDIAGAAYTQDPLAGIGYPLANHNPDLPLTNTQAVLERLDGLRQRCEVLIAQNPRLAGSGEVLLTTVVYCLQTAAYIKACAEGAAVGGLVGNVSTVMLNDPCKCYSTKGIDPLRHQVN